MTTVARVARTGLTITFVLLVAQGRGHLTRKRLLDDELSQLREQPAIPIARNALRLRATHELLDQ